MLTDAPRLLSHSSQNDHLEKTQPVLKIWGHVPLAGEVQISGSKNAGLAIMAATLLCTGNCRLRNIPMVMDVQRMMEILTYLGATVEQQGDRLDINSRHIQHVYPPKELVHQLRASFFVLGPLLARFGEAQVPLPGGCAIGARPVDLHIQGLQAMGADVQVNQGIVSARLAHGRKRLQGAKIKLAFPSVGATETLIMAATLAEGETILENAAQEPEVIDLANFCRAMGAQITGIGTNRMIISGVSRLHSVDYRIIPDRIEAGTFLVAGAITRSPLSLASVNPNHLTAVIHKLREMGAAVFAETADRLRIIPGYQHRGIAIETQPYPDFPTDMQAPLMALLALCEGRSCVSETLFENRLQHFSELNRMGANITVTGNSARIQGVRTLTGTTVYATDLRAAAALVVAALAAEGVTTLHGLQYLDRGYENLEQKLRKLGAKLQRVSLSA